MVEIQPLQMVMTRGWFMPLFEPHVKIANNQTICEVRSINHQSSIKTSYQKNMWIVSNINQKRWDLVHIPEAQGQHDQVTPPATRGLKSEMLGRQQSIIYIYRYILLSIHYSIHLISKEYLHVDSSMLFYPLITSHSYGKSQSLMARITINGHCP